MISLDGYIDFGEEYFHRYVGMYHLYRGKHGEHRALLMLRKGADAGYEDMRKWLEKNEPDALTDKLYHWFDEHEQSTET